MNIVEMHNVVSSITDQVSRTRFEDWQIDQAINFASENIVKNRYDKESVRGLDQMYFDKNAQVRDELRNSIKSEKINMSNNTIPKSSLPDNYWIMVDLEVKFEDGKISYPYPVSYNQSRSLNKDPYLRPNNEEPLRCYIKEVDGDKQIIHNREYNVNQVTLYYLAHPKKVTIGERYTFNEEKGSKYGFTGSIRFVAGSRLKLDHDYVGTYYIAMYEIPNINMALTTITGILYLDSSLVNSDLPDILHQEICNDAAQILLQQASDYKKSQSLQQNETLN